MKNKFADMSPKPLYVSRKVKNAADIVAWAKKQGFNKILAASDMHVTIVYSRSPVDWFKMGDSWASELTIDDGGPRVVERFDGGANVLRFYSSDLVWRNRAMRELGASSDYDEYNPHITISYGDMPDNVEPYSGKIVLGPEVFSEIKDDWAPKFYDSARRFTDKANIGQTKVTGDGYLTALARAVRTGIQEYTGAELGLFDRGIVRVYRPDDEVFNMDSLRSFSHAPVTIDHPAEMVNASNWHDLAVGEVSTEAVRDGEFIALPLILKDQRAIDAVNGGKVELSAGYTADIELVDGVTPDGVKYDAIQRNIRINHLALVDRARAGSSARIGDSAGDQWGAAPLTMRDGEQMTTLKTIVVGDKAVNIAADDADTLTKIIADHAAEIADRDAAIGEYMAKIANLEAVQLTDADIEAKAEERAAVIDRAGKFIDGFDAKGKTVEEIKRAVLALTYGDKAAGFPVVAVDAMFDVLEPAPKKKPSPMRAALGDAKKQNDDPWAGIVKYKETK